MNNFTIISQLHIRISSGDATFSKLLVSLLDSQYKNFEIKILFALSTDTSIHIPIVWTTVTAVLNKYLYLDRCRIIYQVVGIFL